MEKNSVEVIQYAGQVWINQKNLEKKLHKSHYYSSEFKRMRCEIQECGNYQPCRIFIENTLTVEITMNSVKTQAAIFRDGFGINQHDKVLRKQQSLGLRLKKLFPSEDIEEEYFALHYGTDFNFKNHRLMVEIDEKGHVEREPDYKRKRQKELEN